MRARGGPRLRRRAGAERGGAGPVYGDGMILAECIFSQSATGEVSSAYFRKLDHLSGWGVQIFAEGEEEEDERKLQEEGERGRGGGTRI